MQETIANNKRIAKNTLLLYVRMFLTMGVGLYTSRVILDTLGEEDFGIYSVVGGVVVMFSVLSGSLSAAISRFLTFELGRGDAEKLKRIFSASVTIQIVISLVIVLLVETVGVWFLNTKMNIPAERMQAANWVLQFSALTFTIGLVSIPYNACIIAHERMSAFAYVSILEASGKLAIAFLVMWSPFDRLIYYALLATIVAMIVRLVYGHYCSKHFEECKYRFVWDSDLLKQMFGFAGWNFIGASSAVLRDTGGNIIINIFCGPVVNTARGVAMQVNHAIQSFVTNFQTAINPQITKLYASGNNEKMLKLVFQGARLSYYMLLILSLPVLINTHYVLSLWLVEIPEYTVSFVQLVLILTMCESVSGPLVVSMLATGNIKNYQIVVGGLQMLNLPFSYALLSMGGPPESVLYVAIVISQMCLAARLVMLRKMIGLSARGYLRSVYFNVVLVTVVSVIVPLLVSYYVEEGFAGFAMVSLLCLTSVVVTELYVGCNRDERLLVKSYISRLIDKIRNR